MRAAVIAVLACCVLAGSADGHRSATFCRGAQLTGRFAVVPGSAGAGNIVYALRLVNHGTAACSLTGLPQVSLRGRGGNALPTHVHAAHPGALTAVLVTLAPGQAARATARFSPDVPGVGEPRVGRSCEPTAYKLLVRAQGGGTTVVPVSPPTPVCEHGYLSFDAYGRG